jgi:hypothetical protein
MTEQAPARDDAVARSARAAARQLVHEQGPRLLDEVEVAIHARQRPQQYADPVALGALIVSIASLAWTIYQDLRTRTSAPSPHVISRRIRLELSDNGATPAAQRDHVISIVVDEMINEAGK